MKKPVIVFVLVLMLAGVFTFAVLRKSPSAESGHQKNQSLNTNSSKSVIQSFYVKITRKGFVPSNVTCDGKCRIIFTSTDVPHNLKISGREYYIQVGEFVSVMFNSTGNYSGLSDSYDGSGEVHKINLFVHSSIYS